MMMRERMSQFAPGTVLTSPKGDMVVEELISRGGDGTQVQDMRLRNAAGETAVFAIVEIERAIDRGYMARKGA